jgi:hypothetical protein
MKGLYIFQRSRMIIIIIIIIIIIVIVIVIVMAVQPFVGSWPLFSVSWSYTQSVRLLGRGNSPSQGLYLHTKQHKHRINAHNTDVHALSGIRTHDPSVRASEDSSCLRQRDHCDRPAVRLESIIISIGVSNYYSKLLYIVRSRDSVVGIATGVTVRVPVGSRFSSPCCPDRLWGPPNFLSNGFQAAGAWSWPLISR